MLYHNIKNSDEEEKWGKWWKNKEKRITTTLSTKKYNNSWNRREIEMERVTNKKKINMENGNQGESDIIWEKENGWRGDRKNKMSNKRGKKYMKESNSGMIKYVINISLHMWELNN